MRETIYGRNAVYETLRTDRRERRATPTYVIARRPEADVVEDPAASFRGAISSSALPTVDSWGPGISQ
jgi:hypothetical protein